MKRFFALMAVVLAVVSCQKDVDNLDVNMGGGQLVDITISLPETTRAQSNLGFQIPDDLGSEYDLRYILEIYLVEEGVIKYDTCQRFVENSTQKQIVFPVRLVAERDYKIVAWADIVDKGSKDDRYYYTQEGLDNVVIKDNDTVKWNAMDETRDAYTDEKLIEDFNSSSVLNLTLTRPFAKIRVVATDIEDVLKVGIVPTTAEVEYIDNMPYKYNAVADNGGYAFNEVAKKTHSYAYATTATEYTDQTGEYTLFTDYIFVPTTRTSKFTIKVKDAQGREIKSNTFNTEIFVERNKLTTIKGDVLTTGGNVKVTIDNGLAEKETYNVIDSATSFQDAIEEIPTGGSANIELGGDIDLGDLFGAGILSTRSAATLPLQIPEGKTVVLDLNGFTITTPWEDESAKKHYYAFENHGTLTIKDSSEEGDGKIVARGNFNYGTMTLESGTIDACDGNGGYGVRNYAGTFVMTGGSVITSLEDDNKRGNGGNDATPIRVDEGATATINGGIINNISDYTSAIENYGTTTINGGTFTTVHSTIANMGKMTIKGDATIIKCEGEYTSAHPIYASGEASVTTIENGNIIGNDKASCYYVAVKNNSTVYISGGTFTNAGQAAFTGEGSIVVTGGQFDKDPSSCVDSDYTVEQNDNNYVVVRKPDVAKIGEVGYTSLQKAIDAVKESETIVVENNITITEGINNHGVSYTRGASFTLDLNGQTVTSNLGNNALRFKIGDGNDVTNTNVTIEIKNGTVISGDSNWCAISAATASNSGNKLTINLNKVTVYNSKAGDYGVKAWEGATINAKDVTINATKCAGGFYAAGGEIVLDNCTVNQEGLHTAPYMSMAIGVSSKGKLTVNSGNYSTEPTAAAEGYNQGTSHGSWCAGVMNSGGTLIIKGGTFSNDNYGDNALATSARGLLLADTGANIEIKGGTFNAVKAIIDVTNNLGDASRNPSATISGGDFSADPRVSGLYASHLIKVATGYKVVENNGRWTVVFDPAAKIGSTEYATLQEAFNVGGDITLLRDVTVAEPVVLAEGKTAVLDLNGFVINGAEESTVKHIYAMKNYGTLTIKDAKSNGSINSRGIYNYGTLNLNSGKISALDGNGGYAVNNQSGSIFVMNGGWIAADYEDGDAAASGNYDATALNVPAGATATLNGGKITNAGNFTFAVSAAGTLTVPVESTLVISGRHGAISVGGGETTINAGTYSIPENTENTDNVVYVYGGKMTINAGTFIGDCDIPNGGCCVYDASGGVTINGGVFGNSSGGDVWGTTGTVIKGGKFENLTETSRIAEGYEMNANGEVVAK